MTAYPAIESKINCHVFALYHLATPEIRIVEGILEVTYDPSIHHRRSIRLHGHDYADSERLSG